MLNVTTHKRWWFPLLKFAASIYCCIRRSDKDAEKAARWVMLNSFDIRVNGESTKAKLPTPEPYDNPYHTIERPSYWHRDPSAKDDRF